ncbi:SixA phosphatase family protein [Larkinella rosea]|uniref:Phosphohistidine phosphatase n=1 Tax=Larkinella rosea TaxID=2025312 RepID=A0A3P1BI81_9BACT|nr:histidine phosphatase family protein [Larkinella rosea]RRB00797.1 phosphohistidine phosphatase [Larkinella rosea]
MKKTLYLVRHAKAEDRASFQRDHDRDLVPEGIMAAARVGHHLAELGVKPDCLISSTANRAKDTGKVMAEQLRVDPETLVLEPKLFDGGPKAYIAAINNVDRNCKSVMLFGHNPDISYFAEYLTHADVGSMSKGAVAVIEFDDLNWAEVSGRTGHLVDLISPKKLKES